MYRFKRFLALLSCTEICFFFSLKEKQWLSISAFVFLVKISKKDACISHRLKLIGKFPSDFLSNPVIINHHQ